MTEFVAELADQSAYARRRSVDVQRETLDALDNCLAWAKAGTAAEGRAAADHAARAIWAAAAQPLSQAVGPADLTMWITVKGSNVACPFTLFHCERQHNAPPHWTKRGGWTSQVADERRYLLGSARSLTLTDATATAFINSLTERLLSALERVAHESLLSRLHLDTEWVADFGQPWGSVHW